MTLQSITQYTYLSISSSSFRSCSISAALGAGRGGPSDCDCGPPDAIRCVSSGCCGRPGAAGAFIRAGLKHCVRCAWVYIYLTIRSSVIAAQRPNRMRIDRPRAPIGPAGKATNQTETPMPLSIRAEKARRRTLLSKDLGQPAPLCQLLPPPRLLVARMIETMPPMPHTRLPPGGWLAAPHARFRQASGSSTSSAAACSLCLCGLEGGAYTD